MRKSFICILPILLAVLFLCSCGAGKNGGPTLSVTDPTLSITTVTVTESSSQSVTESTSAVTEPVIDIPTETQATSENQEVMLISADPSNPYLNAVVQRYSVNPDRLVAFYASSMESNGNLVFEFDGSVNSSGKPIRTTKTLKNIYTVSPAPELLARKATGTPEEGNEYNEKDSKYCEYFVKWVVFRIYAKDIQNA